MVKTEPGIYTAKACGPAELGTSRVKGTPQVQVPLELENGRKIVWNGYLTEGAAEFTIKALKFLGFKEKSLSKLDGANLENEVSVTLDYEEYDGKQRLRVQWINPIGMASGPISEGEKKALCKQFDSLL